MEELQEPSCIRSIYSLKLLFSISVMLVMLTAVGTLVVLSVGQAIALERSVDKLIRGMEPGIATSIQQLLEIPERATNAMIDSLQWRFTHNSTDHDLYDYTKLSADNYGLIRNYNVIATSFWAWKQGPQMFGFHRPGLHLPPVFLLQLGSSDRFMYNLDQRGMGPDFNNISSVHYNSTVVDRPWWIEITKKNSASWTASFIGAVTPPVVFVSYAIPIFENFTKEIIGAAVTNVAAFTLEPVLRDLDLGQKGLAFIVEPDGNLLATSDKLIRPLITDDKGTRRVHSTSCGDPIIEGVARRVFSNTLTHEVFSVRIQRQKYKVSYRLVKHSGVVWSQVIVLKYSDHAKSTKRSLGVSLSITTVMVTASAAFSLFLSLTINLIFSRLSQELQLAANMQLEDVNTSVHTLSNIAEIRQMQISFLWMVKNLVQYRSFLPANLLASLDQGEDLAEHIKQNKSSNKIHAADTSSLQNSFSGRTSSQVTYNKFEIGLVSKSVTVLNVRFEKFQALVDQLSIHEIVEIHGEFVRRVFDVVTRNRGSVDRFVGDIVYASWNASKPVRSYTEKACNAAIELETMIKLFRIETVQTLLEIDFQMVIATGSVSLGNMGFQKLRSFGIIGDAVDRCEAMVNLCDEYSGSILIDSETLAAVKKWFCVKPLDTIILERRLGGDCQFDLFHLLKRKPSKAEDNEWMYEMSNQEDVLACKQILEIWELMKMGEVNEASVKAEAYLKKHPDDSRLKMFKSLRSGVEMPSTKICRMSISNTN